jgi:transcription initiation factor IIE alpha subunit
VVEVVEVVTLLEQAVALVVAVDLDHQIVQEIEILLEEAELLDKELAEALETSLQDHLVAMAAVVEAAVHLLLETLVLEVAEEMAALV